MSITTINGAENRERVLRAPLDNVNANPNRNIMRVEQMRDGFEVGALRERGLERLADRGIATGNNANGNTNAVGDLVDTTQVELSGAADILSSGIESPEVSPPSLPPGQLTANADGSITTPGGFTIFNDGNHQWRVKDPSGLETRIFGDPHVDEGNDGDADWHFDQDGTFVLPDGTKIFCDTTEVQQGITLSDKLNIQYGDSLGTMDVKAGGAGTVASTGGLAYDSANKDGQIYVMGTDGKWYDGETLGKLYDAGGDFARDVDANNVGKISALALITLEDSLAEEGLELKNDNPVGPMDGVDGDNPLDPTEEQLASLLALEDNAWIVNDTDGEVSAAAAARRRIDQDHILGQANQALDGFESLEELDANGDGVVSGAELDGVKVWIDANDDVNADETEIKLLAEFQVDALKVKMAVTNNDDGTQQLDGQFQRNGDITRTNDRITPLNDGAQGLNFQRQLEREVGENQQMRTIAREQLGRVMDRMQDVNRENEVTRTNGALRNEANRSVRQVNVGGVRA
ncbi:MAG: DUF1521 domain-containing protein [Myxococcota bacterium]